MLYLMILRRHYAIDNLTLAYNLALFTWLLNLFISTTTTIFFLILTLNIVLLFSVDSPKRHREVHKSEIINIFIIKHHVSTHLTFWDWFDLILLQIVNFSLLLKLNHELLFSVTLSLFMDLHRIEVKLLCSIVVLYLLHYILDLPLLHLVLSVKLVQVLTVFIIVGPVVMVLFFLFLTWLQLRNFNL